MNHNLLTYNSLHTHSDYSLLDSCNQVENLAQRAKELGMKALALTDHGNVFGAVKFYNACKKVGVKPIIGCEMYFTHKHEDKERKSRHQLLLCINNEGLANLYKLLTIANTPVDQGGGFYYRPRISWKNLEENNKGLIATTTCMNSSVNRAFFEDGYDQGRDHCKHLKDIFGPERLFVEMQMVNDPLEQPNRNIYIPEQDVIFEYSRKVASELNLKMFASNDCHYTSSDDAFAHEILKCIDAKGTLKTPVVDYEKGVTRGRLVFNGFDYYVKSTEDMLKKFTEEDIRNTEKIADMCNVTFENELKMPLFEKGITPDAAYDKMLTELREGWTFRKIESLPNRKDYEERIKIELKDIKDANLANYFLIVWDVLRYCRENLIPVGPGRGSAAGSLVSYLLQITQIDPVKHELYWERFWNRGRAGSMPDIDVDVSIRRKDDIVQYIKSKFGSDRVFPMMTVGKMESKSVIKDVGKSMGLPHSYLNELTKLIPVIHGKNMSIKDAIEEVDAIKNASEGKDDDIKLWQQEIREIKGPNTKEVLYLNKKIADRKVALIKTFQVAQKLEGCARNRSVHACALLIADRPVNDLVPLCWDAKKKQHITGFDMYDLESLGFLKLDILGLKTLDVIADSHPQGAKCLYDPDSYFGPWDDEEVYDLFAKGRTKGVFQLESPLGRTWCKKVKPQTQGELSDLVSLIRPAVLEIGMADDYLTNRKNPEDIPYIHNDLEPILSTTYGCQLYQEQMLAMVRRFAGFDLAQADGVRKAVGKKIREKMAAIKTDFIDGVNKIEGNEKLADELWTWIEQGAEYGFNKSHAMCYGGVLGYITAYMKVHYPSEFILSLLKFSKTEQDSQQEIMELFYDAKLFGITLKPPSTQKGNIDFKLDKKENNIYFGLSHIKHIGATTIKNIENLGNLSWFSVLLDRGNKKLKKDVFVALILSGAFDHYGLTRKCMKQQFEFVYGIGTEKGLTDKELPIFRKFLEGGTIEKETLKSGKMTYSAGTEETDFYSAVQNFKTFIDSENETMKVVNSRRGNKLTDVCKEFVTTYNDKQEYGPIEKAGFETYYLSVPLTCSEVDIYDNDARKTHNLLQIESELEGVGCCVIAVVNKVNERVDKRGRSMAFIGLQDKTFQMDAPVFADAWSRNSSKIEPGKVLLIEGKKNRGGFQATRVEELV